MSKTTRIWTQSSYHPAFKCGGWAYVRDDAVGLVGQAGGDRYTTPVRMALTGLVAALKEAPKGQVAIQTDNAEVVRVGAMLAKGLQPQGDEAPEADLDLWAQLAAALPGRPATFARSGPDANTPSAFAGAWADLARDKANAKGAFASAIPKPNLAKVLGL